MAWGEKVKNIQPVDILWCLSEDAGLKGLVVLVKSRSWWKFFTPRNTAPNLMFWVKDGGNEIDDV